jgi:uncharacterized protein with FMN-binding domain
MDKEHFMKKRVIRFLPLLIAALMAISGCAAGPSPNQGGYNGIIKAEAQGNNGPVTVQTTFAGGKIAKVELVSHSETPGIADKALAEIPRNMVDYNTVNVDIVSGASNTSRAIIGAVKAAIAQAGLREADFSSPVPAAKAGANIEMTADVVIVGGGVGGIASAIALYEAGVKNIILLELRPSLGGSAYYCMGILQGANSNAHRARGLTTDTPEALYDYWIHITDGKANPALQRRVAQLSGESINWIENMGVKFAPHLQVIGDTTVPRALTAAGEVGGRGIMEPMIARVKSLGIQILMETECIGIIQGSGGTVSGVKARDLNTNDALTINAKAVVMATGDFAAGKDMVRQAGAAFLIHADAEPDGSIYALDGLYVNQFGQRFTNETNYYARIYQDLYESNAEGNVNAYMIVDSGNLRANKKIYYQSDGSPQTWESMLKNALTPGYTYNGLDGGFTYTGNTLEAVLEAAGLPVDVTLKTIARYNELCAAGVDRDFNKSSEYLLPVGTEAPFYAYRLGLNSNNRTPDLVGSPKTDASCRLLKTDGSPIPGLYGAGVIFTNNFKYRMYPGSGTYVQYGLSTGRIIGEEVPKYIR